MATSLEIQSLPHLNSAEYRLQCIDHWSQSVSFWTRYQHAPEARSGLNDAYARLGLHLKALMRADSRPEF